MIGVLEARLVDVELTTVRKAVDNGHGGVELEPPAPVVQAEVVLELSPEALRLLSNQRD